MVCHALLGPQLQGAALLRGLLSSVGKCAAEPGSVTFFLHETNLQIEIRALPFFKN